MTSDHQANTDASTDTDGSPNTGGRVRNGSGVSPHETAHSGQAGTPRDTEGSGLIDSSGPADSSSLIGGSGLASGSGPADSSSLIDGSSLVGRSSLIYGSNLAGSGATGGSGLSDASGRAGGSGRAGSTRRTDPDRRDRIIDAALEVIAADGVSGTTHRRIAARADVPLGSMTYHFDSMDQILREAFGRFATTFSQRFEDRLSTALSHEQAIEAVVAIIHEDAPRRSDEVIIMHELYTLAARDPEYRTITRDWMVASRRALELHFDVRTARELDALIEGLSIHHALDTEPHPVGLTRDAVNRIAAGNGRVP